MGLAITRRQRDLLYDAVLDRLTGIDQIWRSVQFGDWEEAQRLGGEFSDLLRLVVDGLGWGRCAHQGVLLTSPPEVTLRALEAIRKDAAVEDEEQRTQRLVVAETQIERQDTLDACDQVLKHLAPLVAEGRPAIGASGPEAR